MNSAFSSKENPITEVAPAEITAEEAVKAIKAGRAKDVDIAAQIIAENADAVGNEPWSVKEDKQLMRKVDWRLVPILFVCATLSGLDKTAISAAAIYDLKTDLNLSGQQYSWCGSAPFFGGLAFMGPSAYLLKNYPGWKIIFLSIGAFTIIWAGITYWFLPNNPLDTPWLTSRQKFMLIQRKSGDNTGVESPSFKSHQVVEALLDVKTWLIWFAIIALQVPNGGLTTFNTLIISGLGFDSVQTSLLAMPPGAMSTLSGIGLSYLASTTRRYRTPLVAASILLPLLGAILCYTLPRSNLGGQLVGLYILYTYWAPYVTLVSIYQANIAGHSKKLFLYSWFYVSWATGNIIGPQTFRADQAPEYTGGTVAMIVCYVVAIICIMAYGAICHMSNKKRKGEISEVSGEMDWLDLTDRENKAFMYTT
ncbi:putative allantoate [Phaeomoniella chlamydospora]|uniref:Putative allantoate n=1 Tax=Phaeomoniella chlamydospora TaxID=158046 RepID=A0A0G2ENQ5_PHACM|nr:putative allantoate [Phaeomoniella chlamydospora]